MSDVNIGGTLPQAETVERMFGDPQTPGDNGEEDVQLSNPYTQWSKEGENYIPVRKTQNEIPSGLYEIYHNQQYGVYFERVPVNTEEILRFPESTFDDVMDEIQTFWEREEIFREYGIPFKRGILLYGKPGTGKSCLVKLIMEDVIKRDGIVINFSDAFLFKKGVRALREIHPDKPIVVVIEDIDSVLEHNSRTEVLNILDGVTKTDKIVYLATTNYPEKLEPRIINRPSRFDKRFHVDLLDAESRKMYFEFLFSKVSEETDIEDFDIDRWVEDTENLTISHLHELFVAVVILGDDYDTAIDNLKRMGEDINSSGEVNVGF